MNEVFFSPWDLIILYPMITLYKVFELLSFPHPLTFSIIAVTVFLRLLIYPLMSVQIRSMQKMQKLAPEISKIKEIHKGDAKMIQQETMRLYKENGINPAAGCLPMLIQLPILFILYFVVIDIVKQAELVTVKVNEVIKPEFLKLTGPIDQSFFFFPLGQSPAQLFTDFGIFIFIIPLLTGFFQFIQSKMMYPQKKKGEVKKDDFMSIFQSQTLYIFPVMIAVFSYTLPFGLSLYWNTLTLFGIIQQYKVSGLGGLEFLRKNGKR